ncbi:cytoplasmic protein [Nonomuraea sp. SMC257]|uniref:Cytoplasmic protein n=1 Tax=Nonomuraea montanisoli TaxID=2741721 RepID=A0A7Y6IFN0_9ACTN|nr:cytoplasmic protein [Nonomuraea montanisoli]NUW36803.1 cytoplasmic protein [Nonomuraea montanisoli]
MSVDPAVTNPDLYTVVFENERVRVLRYRDRPGDATSPHGHPDSVMVTLSSFTRRLTAGTQQVEVALEAGQVRWLGAQEHAGRNIGDTETHAIFIELKEPPVRAVPSSPHLGPDRPEE